jgi:glycosyltransferase involved in cell wall biosynthesis
MLTSYKTISKNNDFIFSSWRSDIDSILAASDVVCLTSINEGTPVSIIESMASATASISTNVGGVSDIITDSINGCIAKGELASFGEKLLKVIEDKKFRNIIAENGREKSIATYDYKILVNNIENLYSKILINEK